MAGANSYICFRPTAKIANPTIPPATARPSGGGAGGGVFTYGAWACSAARSPASTARHPATCLRPPWAAAARLLPWRPGPGRAGRLCHCAWAGCCLGCRCGEPTTTPLTSLGRPRGADGTVWGRDAPVPPASLPCAPLPGSKMPVTSDLTPHLLRAVVGRSPTGTAHSRTLT